MTIGDDNHQMPNTTALSDDNERASRNPYLAMACDLAKWEGVSLSKLAKLAHLDTATLRKVASPERNQASTYGATTMGKLSRASGLSVPQLQMIVEEHVRRIAAGQPYQEPAYSKPETGPLPGSPDAAIQKLPWATKDTGAVLLRFAVAGSVARTTAEVVLQTETQIPRPPGAIGKTEVYAALVFGESMSPVYHDGDLCFADPSLPVRTADLVIVRQRAAKGLIHSYLKQMISVDGDAVVVRQFHPEASISMPRTTVVEMHRVLSPKRIALRL
jgi:hypothetical protein